MKKLFSLMLVLMGAPVLLQAETVSSVSFNPSRMGEYTYLKVADKANLKGGLNATTINISSGGTVSMTTDSSSRVYQIDTVIGEANSSIDMPNTAFHGNTSNTYSSYDATSSSVPSGLLPTVKVLGGTQQYNNDSYLSTLNAVNMLKQRASTLKGGTLTIGGNESSGVMLYGGDSTLGFHLAGNDIPVPTAVHTNTGKALTNCTLAWEKRKTNDSPAKEVWLLALKNCQNDGSGPSEGCETDPVLQQKCLNPTAPNSRPGLWNLSSCKCLCYPGYTLINGSCVGEATGGSYMYKKTSYKSGSCGGFNSLACAWTYKGEAFSHPSQLPEDGTSYITQPKCNLENLGTVCHISVKPPLAIGGEEYCVDYTCQLQKGSL